MHIRQPAKYIIIAIISIIGLSSCNTTKFLQEDELLLTGNNIKLYGKGNIDQKRAMKYQLSLLYKQTENNNFLLIPREWFYYKTEDANDTTKFDRWQRRVIAEEPAIFDQNLREATEQSMTHFLQHKGYFNANVFSERDVHRKKVEVTYHVTPGTQFTIDSVKFYSSDTLIHRILQEISDESILKKGIGVNSESYERERDRITSYLRNHGYAYFYSNYVLPLEADTTINTKKASLLLEVIPPYETPMHQSYRVGEISVYMDYLPSQETVVLKDSIYENIELLTPHEEFRISPKTIYNAIHLKEDSIFSQLDFDKTNEQLSNLGVFRFVRIKQSIDTTQQGVLNFRIELTQHKKMELGFDLEFNFASRNASGAGNLIGLTASPSLRNRNLFKGAELLITNFSAGVEFSPAPSDLAGGNFWNTVDLRIQPSLYLPRFADYLGIWKGVSKLTEKRLLEEEENTFYEDMLEYADTRISASYTYLLIRDFYQYDLFTATYGFDYQKANNQRLIFNHIGIDYLFPETRPRFDSILLFNPFLERSFGEQLFVSLLFRDLNYVYNSRPNRRGNSYYIGYNLEMAGAELYGINRLLNADTFRLSLGNGATVDFSQYIRSEIDVRRYWQVNPKRSFAARFAFGLARPFGYTSDVPYVKQFFAGGPVSVRAWAPRGLGPGAYEDPLSRNTENNTRLYQTGDIRIEANLEYRFKIFWLLNGALFIDAGNVWTIEEDENRCGSQFLIAAREYDCINENGNSISYINEPFYKQIAVGSGFGLRFDFSYFILRLDLATKIRHSYPYLPNGDSTYSERDYWFRDFREGYGLSKITFNLGFGYPF